MMFIVSSQSDVMSDVMSDVISDVPVDVEVHTAVHVASVQYRYKYGTCTVRTVQPHRYSTSTRTSTGTYSTCLSSCHPVIPVPVLVRVPVRQYCIYKYAVLVHCMSYCRTAGPHPVRVGIGQYSPYGYSVCSS